MCTVSWWRRAGQLSLRFNRDEQWGRAVAEQPGLREGNLIWPKDPQGGGTWICVDRRGTVHCVLNHYDAEMPVPPLNPQSRGKLPLLSAEHAGVPISDWLSPEPFPPFHLFRIPLQGELSQVIWDGRCVETRTSHPDLTLWTTSGWNVHEVVVARASLFEKMLEERGLSEETLTAFHFAFDTENPGRWPCMNRGDARTVSYSEIRVNKDEICFEYTPIGRGAQMTRASRTKICQPLIK
ncbi:NRDE family protein [Kiritimatiellaeota bacterium B1221]|nr:NRDE family protein [Kiritimatiellaeota bacterium B1221]